MEERGQIELWMLTKMAMLFFLAALAMTMVNFSSNEKQALCASQAQAVARSVSGSIQQVINAPAEDERKVIPLESTLSIGSGEFSGYSVFIADHRDETNQRKLFSVTVQGRNKDCVGADSATYPYSWQSGRSDTLTGLSSGQIPLTRGLLVGGAICECKAGTNVYMGVGCQLQGQPCTGGDWILQAIPSFSQGLEKRAYYLIAMKCKEKQIVAGKVTTHLFVQACTNPDPNSCIDFRSGPDMIEACDWQQ